MYSGLLFPRCYSSVQKGSAAEPIHMLVSRRFACIHPFVLSLWHSHRIPLQCETKIDGYGHMRRFSGSLASVEHNGRSGVEAAEILGQIVVEAQIQNLQVQAHIAGEQRKVTVLKKLREIQEVVQQVEVRSQSLSKEIEDSNSRELWEQELN